MSQRIDVLRGWRTWPWRAFALPGLLFLITAIYTFTYHYQLFYFDHWDLVPMIRALDTGSLKAGQLFALHGQHWHASGYIIMLGVGAVTGHSQSALVFVNLGLSLVAFAGVWTVIKRQISVATPRGVWVIPLAVTALFVFSLDQSQNWLWGWQAAVFIHLVGVVWCIEALTRDKIGLADIIFACLMAALAVYGFGTGWALIPIGFAILIARKLTQPAEGWHRLAIWSAFSAGLLWHMALAMRAQNTASARAAEAYLDSRLYADAVFAMNYVASAVTRFSPDIAMPIFLLSAGIALWCVHTICSRGGVTLIKLAPALSLMAYAVGAGLLTAFGRLDNFGMGSAFLGRYISFSNMYWLGLMALMFAALGLTTARDRRGLVGAITLFCLMKMGSIGNVVSSAVPHAQSVRASVAALTSCDLLTNKDELAAIMAPDQMKWANDRISYAHENRLAAFSKQPAENEDCPAWADE